MPSFVSIESPKLGSAVQVNNEENTTVVSVEQSVFGSVAQIIENEIVNVYELDNTDIQSYYNEISRNNAENAQAAQLAAEVAQSAAENAETNAKASELDAEAAQGLAETAQSKAETAQSLSETARDASQAAQSLSETAQAGAELAESNAKASELDAEAAQVAAETAQSKAETAQSLSETAQAGAELAQSLSETARDASQAAQAGAELAESNAKASELDAEAAATAAQTAQSLAETAQAGAETAETNAETAQSLSEAAQAAAEIAETNAEIAEAGSIAARDGSVTAQLAAEAARDAAQTARTGAETAASNSQASASGANSAKVAAQTAQANAETAQSAAETAEANAAASASSAAASASSASTDAARAEAAANTAVNTLSARGDWDASTGVYPTPTANTADFYQISVAGTMTGSQGSMTANIGDQLYWNVDKAVWYKIDNTDHILSVNGQEGAVVLDHTDVGALGATQNAVSASKWQTARTLTLAGDATGAASIDGSSNVTLTVDVANDSHTHDGRYHTKTEADSRFANVSGDTFNGNVAISKGGAKLVLTESDYSTNNSGIDFKTAAVNQNLEMIHEISDSKINTTGGNGQALIVRQTSGSAQAGLEVEGEIFAKANQRVFHDAYHPNADKLTTARTINGTSFNGTANITTAKWGTARTLTIGNTAKSVDGSGNVSWSLDEIGASPRKNWTGVVRKGTWSSVCKLTPDALSGKAIVTINHTRHSVVVGARFLVSFGHSGWGSITQLESHGYSQVKVRLTSDNSSANNVNFEIYDNVGTSTGDFGYSIFVDSYVGGVTPYSVFTASNGTVRGNEVTTIWQAMSINNQRVFADNYHPNADKWTTARTLSLSGDASGSVSINGSSNVTLAVTVANDSHNHDRFGAFLTDKPSSNADTVGDVGGFSVRYLTSSATNKPTGQDHAIQTSSYSSSWQTQQASDWRTNAWYVRTQNNGSWNSWQRLFADNYHPNADKWTTARTLSLSGDVSGSVSWDGSANATLSVTVANDSHTHDGRYFTESESNSRFAYKAGSSGQDFNTRRIITNGTGNDYHSGGIEVKGNGPANTVYPTVGFHQAGLYAGSLQLRNGGDFRFYAQGGSSYGVVRAATFYGALSGNASTASWADTVDVNSGNTSGSWYDIVWHSGDTVYSSNGVEIQGSTNSIKSNRHYFAGTTYYLRESTGAYGTVSTYGRKSGWGGYSIEGRVNFMHNGTDRCGIFDDVNNKWILQSTLNGQASLHHAGTEKLRTSSSGVVVSGTMSVSPVTSSNTASTYSIASQGAGVYAVLWSQAGQSNYSTILIWDGSNATLNGDYGNGLVPAINNAGTVYSAASTNWKPKRVVKIG
ncbi:tail fiber protein [Vibrio alginolyticus]|uniref:tail fiber protein n=1 Tax=Vibrio alginolyticus TaxID=663 RepID=UPI00384B963E